MLRSEAKEDTAEGSVRGQAAVDARRPGEPEIAERRGLDGRCRLFSGFKDDDRRLTRS
jgi:hypothetical protein